MGSEVKEKDKDKAATNPAQPEPKPPFAEAAPDSSRDSSRSCCRGRATRRKRYSAAGKLEGKAALITGGDSGIGRAVAVLYAREGADVAIVYLPEEQSRRRRDASARSRPRAATAC